MSQAWKKLSSIRPGTVIVGKWHQKHYTIRRRLGRGAVGTVYLCEQNGRYAALKISDNAASMTVEVNVLKSLEKVQGNRLGPSLLDVDDWEAFPGDKYVFYVMEYLHGEPLTHFINRHGHEWAGIFMVQLLDDLEQLHQAGWVLGDVKPENMIVVSSPAKVRWIDVGGTTQIGRSIKEYTEFFDRGYWGMGSRRAEPSYDLFALAMIFLTVYYPNRFDKGPDPKGTLFQKLHDVKALRLYRNCLKKALTGSYQSSAHMRNELMAAMNNARARHNHTNNASSYKNSVFKEGIGIMLLTLVYYVSSLFLP
ncbi:hypothetical protein GCM10008983_15450 [Lentibacillus halophilus]|uniref:Protein kinase domain-containing protein n=1 Tax=Lentibacillus halophilus TaxID=295065 RepID=A0ABP3J2T5_9BACI